jgi:hypothetical protein
MTDGFLRLSGTSNINAAIASSVSVWPWLFDSGVGNGGGGSFSGWGFGADLTISSDPTKKLVLAAQLRDFFTTRILWNNGTDEVVVPSSNLEASYGFNFPSTKIPLRLYCRTEILFEGREEAATFSFDPVSLDFHTGLEARLHHNFDLLLGYDIDHLTTGLALKYQQFGLTYCFELETELDNSHRIAINWSY